MTTEYPVTLDWEGVARVGDTPLRVTDIARLRHTFGMTPEQIQQAVSPLTLEQVYGALAYYDAHQEALDAETERKRAEVERAVSQLKPENSLPPGESGFARIIGKWPGNETDEEIAAALERMS